MIAAYSVDSLINSNKCFLFSAKQFLVTLTIFIVLQSSNSCGKNQATNIRVIQIYKLQPSCQRGFGVRSTDLNPAECEILILRHPDWLLF